ncbi:MAG: hypothetical protein M3Y40_05240 [Chloroflexota bacterium]|nr:hypothetical protein [Chloroflexota bacterium]
MSAPQRIVAALVLILVAVGVAFVALTVAGVPVGLGPGQSAGVSAAPSVAPSLQPSLPSPEPSAEPTSPDDEDLLAELAAIEAQVIGIRGLEAADIGPPDIITRAELGDELLRMFDEQYPPEEREKDNLALRALGLLGPDEDVAELQLQLLGDQVLGFYDPVEKRMVVVSDAGLDPAAKLTYAHEYTHALQDAAFQPSQFDPEADVEDDRALALTSLTEGDASLTMFAWAFEHLSQQELIEIGASQEIPDTEGIPSWMVNQLQFPYTAGQVWASSLAGSNPLAPDYAELDAAYEDPPDSTEQIIDLDAWEPRENPVGVEVPDLVALLGDGWEEVDETAIGQASIGFILEFFGLSRDDATVAATGWGGDRVTIVTGQDGAFAVAWRLAWDTAADADEFRSAYESVLDDLPFPAEVRAIGSDEVLVVHASDDAILLKVADAAD